MNEPENLAGRLTPAGHELRQRVYFEDTDFSGRVYHARYLHFMERGRTDFLRLLGIVHTELARSGLVFAVRRMTIDFLKPAAIDDVLTISTELAAVRGASVELRQSVTRDKDTLVSAHVTVALIGAGGRPARLPEAVRSAFQSCLQTNARPGPIAGGRHRRGERRGDDNERC